MLLLLHYGSNETVCGFSFLGMLWVRDCALFYVFVLMRMSFALNCDLILSPLVLEFAREALDWFECSAPGLGSQCPDLL